MLPIEQLKKEKDDLEKIIISLEFIQSRVSEMSFGYPFAIKAVVSLLCGCVIQLPNGQILTQLPIHGLDEQIVEMKDVLVLIDAEISLME